MDIRNDLERIHAAKVDGKPLMHCLREVVKVSARILLAGKFSGDDIRWRASQAAWEAAVEYDWVVTDVERERARGFLRAHADQWIAEALSGEPDSLPSPDPVPQQRADITRLVADPMQGRVLRAAAKQARYLVRAEWLQARLVERKWDKHDLARYGGPNHKTTQKVLDGFTVQDGVLQKIAQALSEGGAKVSLTEIPQK
jgi:hypothetical protein